LVSSEEGDDSHAEDFSLLFGKYQLHGFTVQVCLLPTLVPQMSQTSTGSFAVKGFYFPSFLPEIIQLL
jgi:hypothetical protein